MPTANARKGAEAERMVAKYLRTQGFPDADRRLREGRADDQGDIDGVPLTTIQVKYWKQHRLQAWVTDTLRQRETAGMPFCLIVSRTPYRAVEGWDAYMPLGQIYPEQIFGEEMTFGWIRMDLALAVALLRRKITETGGSSLSFSPTTQWILPPEETTASPSVLSTENESPRSPTT